MASLQSLAIASHPNPEVGMHIHHWKLGMGQLGLLEFQSWLGCELRKLEFG